MKRNVLEEDKIHGGKFLLRAKYKFIKFVSESSEKEKYIFFIKLIWVDLFPK